MAERIKCINSKGKIKYLSKAIVDNPIRMRQIGYSVLEVKRVEPQSCGQLKALRDAYQKKFSETPYEGYDEEKLKELLNDDFEDEMSLEGAQAAYEEKFGRKPNKKMTLESIIEKLA